MTAAGPPSPPVRRRALRAIGWSVLTAAILVAAGWSIWWAGLWRRPPGPLEPGWRAAVFVLAGDGASGWRDAQAWRARFSDPFGVAVRADGTVYVADAGDSQRIRAIAPDGRVTTVAGSVRGFADGAASAAQFDTPSGVAVDASGTIYVADTANNAIRRIAADGYVTTLAGDGVAGDRDGRGRDARFNGPIGLALDGTGRLIVADTYNDRIRAIAPDGTVTTLAGQGPGMLDGPAGEALFDTPCGVAVDDAGTILVADTGNGLIRILDAHGRVTTAALPEPVGRPMSIASGSDGTVYVADERGRILEASLASGAARTLAGSAPGFRDGPAGEARFRRPSGIAAAGHGRLVVADTGNALIRIVSALSRLDLRVPPPPFIAPGFDADAFARHPLLWPVAPMEGPHEIAGTIGEARGGEGSERFHAGIDVRLDEGTPVLAVRDGTVSAPISTGAFESLNEWLRIGPVTYVHIRAGRERRGREQVLFDDARFVPTRDGTGAVVRVRVKRGARFVTGEPIATVNRFNHVHLNVGWPGEEHNPLRFRLAQFVDTVPPTIPRGGVRLFDEAGELLRARARGRLVVSGRVHVVVDAWDQADGNRPNRRLGLYALGYQILGPDGASLDTESASDRIRFDQLADDRDAPRIVYAPGSGIPFYGRRTTRFLYAVTNTFRNGVAEEGVWDTARLPPGDYTLRAWATDISGNTTRRDVPVTVEPPALAAVDPE